MRLRRIAKVWDIAAAIEIMAENFWAGDICGTGKLTVKVRNGPRVTFGSAAVKHRTHASERRRVVIKVRRLWIKPLPRRSFYVTRCD